MAASSTSSGSESHCCVLPAVCSTWLGSLLDFCCRHKGVFLSLTRQILFLLPLYLILPRFFGIDGIIYSGPVADLLAFICTMVLVTKELKEIRGLMAAEAS